MKARFIKRCLITMLASASASAQNTAVLSLTDPRPLARAADLLERQTGIAISYVATIAGVNSVLNAALAAHVVAGNAGLFRIEQIGGRFVVEPAETHDGNGVPITDQSPLDATISFPAINRSASETLRVICKAISDSTSKKVLGGMNPFSGLGTQTVTLGAS